MAWATLISMPTTFPSPRRRPPPQPIKHRHFIATLAAAGTEEKPAQPTPVNCRPAVILPGLGNNSSDYQKLQVTLKEYGVPTVVAKVSRVDWLRNAAGLLDPNYWRGTLRPRPVLDWYLKRVDEAVQEARILAEGQSLSLIGHSAGGWLARLYMEEFGLSNISLLLTLGTPHLPPPKGLPGVIDQTRGLLDYVDRYCAKAIYTPDLKYVCGQADVWGDGVVPESSAHLEGALNITLDGIYHSPVGSDDTLRPWYGSPAIVETWIHHLLS
ncbi:PREDICTED: uncharacterized protein LOC104610291 isoform X2 [Nelumbo nucifera]|uniref:GPI inositol-deacylase n=1 Tax=Nelumbo nucifera TaxID=4432 RepID=A0A1U8BEL6_NELNU|nr:PREDICTED: uncharacterized protein LOC104610291 isoform X2 [Nelumbo nucifera]